MQSVRYAAFPHCQARAALCVAAPSFQVAPLLPLQRRDFSKTDGPFRHIRPSFTERKKHYNEVLVMADVRKLLETLQDVLQEPHKTFPVQFWEVLAKRCIQSMHLLKPMELAIVARAFDIHSPALRPRFDVFVPIAEQAQARPQIPGLAVWVLADVLPRRVHAKKVELAGLVKKLGRHAAATMWEIPPKYAVALLEALTSAGVRDPSLSARVSKKVAAQLSVPGALSMQDLASAASALAGQEHRDLQTLNAIAEALADLYEDAPTPEGAEAAKGVLAAFHALDVDHASERLSRVAADAPGEFAEAL